LDCVTVSKKGGVTTLSTGKWSRDGPFPGELRPVKKSQNGPVRVGRGKGTLLKPLKKAVIKSKRVSQKPVTNPEERSGGGGQWLQVSS